MDKIIKIISALDNHLIQDNFKKSYEDIDFLLEDISYQEGLLGALKTASPDAIIINLDIEGDLDKFSFIQAIRDTNDTVKVILIMKAEDKEYSNWLVTKGVYDVFVDGKCTFQDIHEAVIREQKVIVKKEIQKEYIEKEKIITKEKVIKEVVSVNFKKLILSVWGNAEFACEFAYITARLTRFRILLLNLDFISPTADIYLNLSDRLSGLARDPPKNFGLGYVIEVFEKSFLTSGIFEQACLKRKEPDNLYILMDTGGIDSFDRYKGKDISTLIDRLYRDFDIVILILNKSIYDPFTITALLKSDYNIIAIPANADAIKEFESCFLYMNVKHNIPVDKSRFVTYEYKKGVNYPLNHLKDIFTENCFLGAVSYSAEREMYRNINSCYAKWIVKKNPSEYISILSKLNIVPQKPLRHKIRDWLMKKAGKLTRKIIKNKNENGGKKHE